MAVGEFAYVQYVADPGWHHMRFLAGWVQNDDFVIMSPDFAVYVETMAMHNRDLADIRFGDELGTRPVGLPAPGIYAFAPVLTAVQRNTLMAEGRRLAAVERRQLGLAPDAQVHPAVPGGAAAPPGGAARPPEALPDVAADGKAPAGWGWKAMEDVEVCSLKYGDSLEVGNIPGNVRLLHRTGARAVMQLQDQVFFGMLWKSAEGDVAKLATWRGEDARVMPVTHRGGARHKDWGIIAETISEDKIPQWPIDEPRTTAWCVKYMLKEGGAALHHECWKSRRRLDIAHYGVEIHELLSRVLETLGTYDQLNVGNLAGCELIVRHLQLIEHFYDEKDVDTRVIAGRQHIEEVRAFLGGSRSASMVCPALLDIVSKDLERVSNIKKNARKLREEAAATATKGRAEKGGADAGGSGNNGG